MYTLSGPLLNLMLTAALVGISFKSIHVSPGQVIVPAQKAQTSVGIGVASPQALDGSLHETQSQTGALVHYLPHMSIED